MLTGEETAKRMTVSTVLQSLSYTRGHALFDLTFSGLTRSSPLPPEKNNNNTSSFIPFVSVCDFAIIVTNFVTRAVARKLPVLQRLARACLSVPPSVKLQLGKNLVLVGTKSPALLIN